MQWLVPILALLGACVPQKVATEAPHGGGPAMPAADAGSAPADAGGAAIAAGCTDGMDSALDAGPPADGGLRYSAGPTPASDQQSAVWVPTGAADCEGLVPARVPPRLSWAAPGPGSSEGEPVVDGQGDLAFGFDGPSPGLSDLNMHAFFPADGGAGLLVGNSSTDQPLDLFERPQGFFMRDDMRARDDPRLSPAEWVRAVSPDGSDQGFVREVKPQLFNWLWPDPRGGYVETRVRMDFCHPSRGFATPNFDMRWVDADLHPRSAWWPVMSWTYWNFYPQVFVDVLGNALVLVQKQYPMSMGCQGADTLGFWVSESGSVVSFAPVTPTYRADCSDAPLGFAGFGAAVALNDGGFAFYLHPNPSLAFSLSGWYARYPSDSGTPTAPPAWLLDHDGTLQRLANGTWLGTRRDPTTCARTAEIVGPAGQVCATLALDGSAGCDVADRISPDGTLVLHEWGPSSARWWPGLGRAR